MIEKLNNEVGSDWKSVVVMLFFVVPFFRPTIINDWAAVSVLKSVFAIWLLAACAVAVARFIVRNGRIGLFLLGLASMLLVMYISTFAHGGSSYDAMTNTAMILSSALLVTTLEKREVRPFLLALAGLRSFSWPPSSSCASPFRRGFTALMGVPGGFLRTAACKAVGASFSSLPPERLII